MMDQTYIMNHVKERCCYVAESFKQDLEICRYGIIILEFSTSIDLFNCSSNPKRSSIVQEYVLPDYSSNRMGHVRLPTDELEAPRDLPILSMGNERFSVPELLFNPSDIGKHTSYSVHPLNVALTLPSSRFGASGACRSNSQLHSEPS